MGCDMLSVCVKMCLFIHVCSSRLASLSSHLTKLLFPQLAAIKTRLGLCLSVLLRQYLGLNMGWQKPWGTPGTAVMLHLLKTATNSSFLFIQWLLPCQAIHISPQALLDWVVFPPFSWINNWIWLQAENIADVGHIHFQRPNQFWLNSKLHAVSFCVLPFLRCWSSPGHISFLGWREESQNRFLLGREAEMCVRYSVVQCRHKDVMSACLNFFIHKWSVQLWVKFYSNQNKTRVTMYTACKISGDTLLTHFNMSSMWWGKACFWKKGSSEEKSRDTAESHRCPDVGTVPDKPGSSMWAAQEGFEGAVVMCGWN